MSSWPWNVGYAAAPVKRLRALATVLAIGAMASLSFDMYQSRPTAGWVALTLIGLSLAVRAAALLLQRRLERTAWKCKSL